MQSLNLGNWKILTKNKLKQSSRINRVTSLEQLSLVVSKQGQSHKKVLGIWLDLVLKVKYSTILIFKFYVKNQPNLYEFFFIEEFKNGRLTFIIDIFC